MRLHFKTLDAKYIFGALNVSFDSYIGERKTPKGEELIFQGKCKIGKNFIDTRFTCNKEMAPKILERLKVNNIDTTVLNNAINK